MSTPCIILAGGLGTRLQKELPNLPKCLAPIGDLPFLAWQIHSLAERGVKHFIISLGYRADAVLTSLEESWANGLNIETVIESELLGTGGATSFVMRETKLDEAIIVNGDTFLNGSIDGMMNPLKLDEGELMRIATVNVAERKRFGGLILNAEKKIVSFLEKGQVGAGTINAGLYRIHRTALHCDNKIQYSMEKDIIPKLASIGALHAQEINGYFINIGIP